MDGENDRTMVRSTSLAGWQIQGRWDPLMVVRAEGSRFWDSSGREFLDLSSQQVAANLGYGNPSVTQAIVDQARRLPYVSPSFASPIRAQLSRALGSVLPPGLNHYFFSSSGTEANEAALRMARGGKDRRRIVARSRSYHGSTAASLSVSGDLRRRAVEPVQSSGGTIFAPDCYCYRCPFGLEYPSCHVACAEYVGELIDRTGDVAAMILEPVTGTNGVLVPVPKYLPRIREITRDRDVWLIADEVMTGWGRIGEWFAMDRWKVVPDLLTTAKGLTGAYAPLGLTAASDAVVASWQDRLLPWGHTYEAHTLTLAPAVAAIEEYRRGDLLAKSRRDGEYLLARLREIQERHRSVGDVRGIGLFAAVELVRNRGSKEPFNTEEDRRAGRPLVVEEVARAMMAEGVYCMTWVSHLIVAPPLIITRPELDRGLEVLDRALDVADRRSTERSD